MIKVKNLTKSFAVHKKEEGVKGSIKAIFKREYNHVIAVKDISFKIDDGELIGFIGPNGAGKTTTLKMLSGLIYPTSGDIKVEGYTPFDRKNEFLKKISLVMGQKSQIWWDLPAIETLNLNKDIYEVPDAKYKKILDELVEMLDVKDFLHIQARKLSLGQRMKFELAAALIHQPKVLFLDEPTIGLDIVVQKKLRTFIKDYNKKLGATIILTSHYMDDVKELCKRIIIIDKGVIMFDGDLDSVIKKYAGHKILTVTFNKTPAKESLEKIAKVVEYTEPTAKLSVDREKASELASILFEKYKILDINIEEPKLEEVIRDIFVTGMA